MYKVRIEDTDDGQVVEYDASTLMVVLVEGKKDTHTVGMRFSAAKCDPMADISLYVTVKKQIEEFYQTPYGAILRQFIEGEYASNAVPRAFN